VCRIQKKNENLSFRRATFFYQVFTVRAQLRNVLTEKLESGSTATLNKNKTLFTCTIESIAIFCLLCEAETQRCISLNTYTLLSEDEHAPIIVKSLDLMTKQSISNKLYKFTKLPLLDNTLTSKGIRNQIKCFSRDLLLVSLCVLNEGVPTSNYLN
jgi:hypothetical protein